MSWLAREPVALFLAQVIVIIAASRLVGVVARRFGQPVVIAEILAGIALGPSILGAVAPDFADGLFPRGSLGVVRLVSQLGLLMFMFLVGLELDGRLLRGRERSSIAISIFSIAVPFTLGAALASWLQEQGLADGVPRVTFLLFVATAMSVTAFPVLARILSERGLLRSRVGTVTIACAAVDDVIAWCLLAFVVALARAGELGPAIATTGIAIAYVGVMFLVVRPVLARIASRVGSARAPTQNTVALVVVGMLISGLTTEWIGIHALFGAFLFGVITPRANGFARSIAERLEDVVMVVLLPLFFVVSGLRTEIGLLDTRELWFACGATILVACAGKFAGGAVAARLTGLSWREAGAVGILMNTRGLMELIVLNIGLDLGVITPAVFSIMVIMALVSTLVTTPILERIYPASAMARDLVDDLPASAPPVRTGYRLMTCVADERSAPGMMALARVLLLDSDRLVVLHLSAPSVRASSQLATSTDAPDGDVLEPVVARARTLGMAARPLSFVSSRIGDDIARVAEIQQLDLVLVGVHRPVVGQTHLGGVVRDVMRQSSVAVAAFVDRELATVDRVLVPFLGSPHDRAALALAARLQRITGATITVLHVMAEAPREGDARSSTANFAEVHGPVVVDSIVHESPAVAVLERATDHDLVIVGMGKEWGLGDPRFGFGLQPERLLRDCPRSILVVRGPRSPEPSILAPARVTEG